MICTVCGTACPEGAKFCMECGAAFPIPETPVPEEPVMPTSPETDFPADPAPEELPPEDSERDSAPAEIPPQADQPQDPATPASEPFPVDQTDGFIFIHRQNHRFLLLQGLFRTENQGSGKVADLPVFFGSWHGLHRLPCF